MADPYRAPPPQARLAQSTTWPRLAWAWCRGVFRRMRETPHEKRSRWLAKRWGLHSAEVLHDLSEDQVRRLLEDEHGLQTIRSAVGKTGLTSDEMAEAMRHVAKLAREVAREIGRG